ncbi:MAG: hypothetical protein M1824_002922 [Vezdaea acicularis]|nr:MAG: hypothetical protein M1824_002922 [Vezdaea acicularis]
MSDSPPKSADVEPEAQSPDDRENNHMDPEHQGTEAQALGYEFDVKEQDRWLPIANVARIMKTALPENAKIAKEAKECMQECVSEFISFITSEASEKCHQEKRKTVNGEDILFAMTSLGFENYAEALKIYLSKYRELWQDIILNNEIDWWHETQSARGESTNRPGSGFGAGGPVGGSSGAPNATPSTAFQGDPEGSNHILTSPTVQDQNNNAFGAVYPSIVPGHHNGVGGGPY